MTLLLDAGDDEPRLTATLQAELEILNLNHLLIAHGRRNLTRMKPVGRLGALHPPFLSKKKKYETTDISIISTLYYFLRICASRLRLCCAIHEVDEEDELITPEGDEDDDPILDPPPAPLPPVTSFRRWYCNAKSYHADNINLCSRLAALRVLLSSDANLSISTSRSLIVVSNDRMASVKC